MPRLDGHSRNDTQRHGTRATGAASCLGRGACGVMVQAARNAAPGGTSPERIRYEDPNRHLALPDDGDGAPHPGTRSRRAMARDCFHRQAGPPSATGPAMIHIHGGGWLRGCPGWRDASRPPYRACGMNFINVDDRLIAIRGEDTAAGSVKRNGWCRKRYSPSRKSTAF
jgi:hypothetical protein